MIKFLKSIFGGQTAREVSAEQSDPTAAGENPRGENAAEPTSNSGAPVRAFTHDQIVSDLVAQICTTMPDPRPFEEIDVQIHMYDAGYVTSITAADLLAHIEGRYGVDISETKLIGPLQNLEALASHIESQSS